MSIWKNWGFAQSPFDAMALQPNEAGERLLIGRDKDLESIISESVLTKGIRLGLSSY